MISACGSGGEGCGEDAVASVFPIEVAGRGGALVRGRLRGGELSSASCGGFGGRGGRDEGVDVSRASDMVVRF